MNTITAGIKLVVEKFPQRAATALKKAVQPILAESQELVPIRTGALKATGALNVEIEGNAIIATISYGSDEVGYAVIVHEDLEAHHPVGEAKFLERPLLDAAPTLGAKFGVEFELGTS